MSISRSSIGMSISGSSALSINVLLIFEIHDLNFMFSSFLSLIFSLKASAKRSISPFTTTYASLYSHKSDLNIEVLNLIFLLTVY